MAHRDGLVSCFGLTDRRLDCHKGESVDRLDLSWDFYRCHRLSYVGAGTERFRGGSDSIEYRLPHTDLISDYFSHCAEGEDFEEFYHRIHYDSFGHCSTETRRIPTREIVKIFQRLLFSFFSQEYKVEVTQA